MRLSPSLSEFKPTGAVKKAELACVSGGSHVVVICSHGNLPDGKKEEAAQGSNMVILQFSACVHACIYATLHGVRMDQHCAVLILCCLQL